MLAPDTVRCPVNPAVDQERDLREAIEVAPNQPKRVRIRRNLHLVAELIAGLATSDTTG